MTEDRLAEALADSYLLEEELGRGASATVYLAQDRLAQIYMLAGQLDQAVATLRPVLTYPTCITPAELTSDPLWTPLRTHPGFASLLAAP